MSSKSSSSIKRPSELYFPLRQWLELFFQYALKNKKNFYWAWKSFLIVVRKHGSKLFLVLEIPLKQAPFLVQKHVDITNIPKPVVVQSLLLLFDLYDSSPMLPRNREYSVRFLSFISFLQMLLNGDIILPKELDQQTPLNQKLLVYILKTLDDYNIEIMLRKKPNNHVYSLFQLASNS